MRVAEHLVYRVVGPIAAPLRPGRFAANGAWLAVQVMAHNLARWIARIGLGERIVATKTLRRRLFATGRAADPLGPPGQAAPGGPLAVGARLEHRPRPSTDRSAGASVLSG